MAENAESLPFKKELGGVLFKNRGGPVRRRQGGRGPRFVRPDGGPDGPRAHAKRRGDQPDNRRLLAFSLYGVGVAGRKVGDRPPPPRASGSARSLSRGRPPGQRPGADGRPGPGRQRRSGRICLGRSKRGTAGPTSSGATRPARTRCPRKSAGTIREMPPSPDPRKPPFIAIRNAPGAPHLDFDAADDPVCGDRETAASTATASCGPRWSAARNGSSSTTTGPPINGADRHATAILRWLVARKRPSPGTGHAASSRPNPPQPRSRPADPRFVVTTRPAISGHCRIARLSPRRQRKQHQETAPGPARRPHRLLRRRRQSIPRPSRCGGRSARRFKCKFREWRSRGRCRGACGRGRPVAGRRGRGGRGPWRGCP